MRYCAQLPEPDCKSGRVAHKVCRTTGRADPPAFKTAGFPIATRLRRPGALRPPVPPTGKVPAPGTVLNFYCVKIAKPGVLSIGLSALSALLRTGTLPVVIQRRKRWPPEATCARSAQLPEPD